jgi:hypothetical protein
MLANSVSVQVSSNFVGEETVWVPSGPSFTIRGRSRLLFGALGPPPRWSRGWENAGARRMGGGDLTLHGAWVWGWFLLLRLLFRGVNIGAGI